MSVEAKWLDQIIGEANNSIITEYNPRDVLLKKLEELANNGPNPKGHIFGHVFSHLREIISYEIPIKDPSSISEELALVTLVEVILRGSYTLDDSHQTATITPINHRVYSFDCLKAFMLNSLSISFKSGENIYGGFVDPDNIDKCYKPESEALPISESSAAPSMIDSLSLCDKGLIPFGDATVHLQYCIDQGVEFSIDGVVYTDPQELEDNLSVKHGKVNMSDTIIAPFKMDYQTI